MTGRPGALPRPTPERTAVVLTLLAIVGISIYSLAKAEISIANMLGSIANAERFLARVGTVKFPPLAELLELTALTLGLVLTGTLLAAVLSVPVAYIAAANTTPGPAFQAVGRFITVFTRAIPDVVFAMVFILVFSIGALPGILAIGLHSIGMISKLFADAIEQIDEGPRLAIRAAGRLQDPGIHRRRAAAGAAVVDRHGAAPQRHQPPRLGDPGLRGRGGPRAWKCPTRSSR